MKNINEWQPSKYVYRKGYLIASRDPKEVNIGSRLITEIIAEIYNNILQTHAKGKLLDLGCGRVPLYSAYKNYITDNTCVDWHNTFHKNCHLDFECDITKKLPFEENYFDTIILSDVLEHIPQPECLWVEMSRILAKNGKIIVNVPFYYWLHEQPHDYYRYTEFALRRFVETCGLRLVQIFAIGGVPEIMTDIFAKNICQIPMIGNSLAIFSQWITLSFIKTNLGEKVSTATGKDFPLGYFLIAEKVK